MGLCGVCGQEVSIRHEAPCGHSFCYLCIKRSLGKESLCPVCRTSCKMDDMTVGGECKDGRCSLSRGKGREREDAKVIRGLWRLRKHIREDDGIGE